MTELNENPEPSLSNRFARVRKRIELSDALVFLYALVFIRQYLWILDHNVLAWAISVPLAAVCWYFYVATKPLEAEKLGVSFWLVVGLPLLAAYLLRAALPDHSFDVLTYHLLQAERTLRGTPLGRVITSPCHSPSIRLATRWPASADGFWDSDWGLLSI